MNAIIVFVRLNTGDKYVDSIWLNAEEAVAFATEKNKQVGRIAYHYTISADRMDWSIITL